MSPENTPRTKGPFALQENTLIEFESLLDTACVKLQDKQAKYFMRRIRELDAVLESLEKELDSIAQLENP